MAVLKILEYPDTFLTGKAMPVKQIDEKILKLIDDMTDTMFDAPGVGLAAPQVGSGKRIVIYNPTVSRDDDDNDNDDNDNENKNKNKSKSKNKNKNKNKQSETGQTENVKKTQKKKQLKEEARAIINPEIISASGSLVSEKEACLSVPDFSANVKRFSRVTVKGINVDGKKIQFDVEDIQAVILQHEIDHLDGILYIDRISVLKRNMYKKRIKKKKKTGKK